VVCSGIHAEFTYRYLYRVDTTPFIIQRALFYRTSEYLRGKCRGVMSVAVACMLMGIQYHNESVIVINGNNYAFVTQNAVET
jgi:hypothetical protein